MMDGMNTSPPPMEFPSPVDLLPYMGNLCLHENSRYGEARRVLLLDPDAGVFLVYGKSAFSRMGWDENTPGVYNMYDFDGGPFFMVGEEFYGFGTIAALLPTKTKGLPSQGIEERPAVLVSVDYSKKGYKEIQKWRKQNSGR